MAARRLCVVVCANGFGHVVRELQIVQRLLDRVPALQVTLACAPWQMSALSAWPLLAAAVADRRIRHEPFEPYPRWSRAPGFLEDDAVLTWHESLASLQLDGYDLVLSDNIVEVLAFTRRALLVGSFFWHDVYAAFRQDSPVTREYFARCSALLADGDTPMIGSRDFAMPEVRRRTVFTGVGLLPPLVRRSTRPAGRGVLLTGSPESPALDVMQAMLERRRTEPPSDDARLFIDARLAARVPVPSGATPFRYHADDFDAIGAVVGRAGLGTITDCIATGTPLFCVPDASPEMVHNVARLEALGLGWPLTDGAGLDAVSALLGDPVRQARYGHAAGSVDREGLTQAVDVVAAHLN